MEKLVLLVQRIRSTDLSSVNSKLAFVCVKETR